jgi:hypothetical protein
MRQRQGANFCSLFMTGVPQAPAKWMRQRQELNFSHSRRQRLETQFPTLWVSKLTPKQFSDWGYYNCDYIGLKNDSSKQLRLK